MRELPSPISVKAALKEAVFTIDVPNDTSMTVGPFEEQYHEAFHLVEITEFTDLHHLGFIHPDLSEDKILNAIRVDDRLHREAVQHQRFTADEPCSCEESSSLATPYVSRRRFQNNLIDLIQPLYRESLSLDDPAVIHPYRYAQAWFNRTARMIIGLYHLLDINIGDHATLTMTPTVQALYASTITIGKKGCLRFTSGNVHVRASTLNGPNPFASDTIDLYVHGLSREQREN
jgi:hypothetical protein